MIASASPSPGAQQPDRPHKIVVLRVEFFIAQAASAAPGEIDRGDCVVQFPQGAGPIIIEGVVRGIGQCGLLYWGPVLRLCVAIDAGKV